MTEQNLTGLMKRLAALDARPRARFDRLFSVTAPQGSLVVPDSLRPRIESWFGRQGDTSVQEAWARTERQTVFRILNRWTFEGTMFNPLRAGRPHPPRSPSGLAEHIQRSRDGCDFCDPLKRTTADTWGRIEGRHCLTAANAAKYDAHHGLIVFHRHDPLHLPSEVVLDLLEVADLWFARTHEMEPAARFPILVWNCLEKSAATQVHGHANVLLNAAGHYAAVERLREAAENYYATFNDDYFDDFAAAHGDIGLSCDIGPVACLAHLTPIKEREVVLIDRSDGRNLGTALHAVFDVFIRRFGVTSFTVGIAYPPLVPEGGWESFPVVARVVDRGDARASTGDIGAMELYGTTSVASDPYEVIAALNTTT